MGFYKIFLKKLLWKLTDEAVLLIDYRQKFFNEDAAQKKMEYGINFLCVCLVNFILYLLVINSTIKTYEILFMTFFHDSKLSTELPTRDQQ